jgi:hypothetical protein
MLLPKGGEVADQVGLDHRGSHRRAILLALHPPTRILVEFESKSWTRCSAKLILRPELGPMRPLPRRDSLMAVRPICARRAATIAQKPASHQSESDLNPRPIQ